MDDESLTRLLRLLLLLLSVAISAAWIGWTIGLFLP